MAGWGALSAALAGAATGVAQRNQNRRQRADQQAQDAEKKREFDVDADLRHQDLATRQAAAARQKQIDDANLRAQGIDPATGQPLPFNVPKQLSQVIPNNKGRVDPNDPHASGPTPDQVEQHYRDLASAAMSQGRPDLAAFYGKQADGVALSAQRTANAAYTSGARTDLTNAQTGLTDARTTTEAARQELLKAQAAAARDLPARARQIAAGHDAASLQRATLQANNRTELAHYNGNVRTGLAQLTAAYHLQGMEYGAATRAAIDQYNQSAQNYRQQMTPAAQFTRDPNAAAPMQPTFVMPQAPSTPLTINLGGNGSLVGPNGELTPAMQDRLRAFMNRGGGTGGRNPNPASNNAATPTLSPKATTVLDKIRATVQSGVPLDTALKTVSDNAAYYGLTPGDVAAIARAARGGASPSAPRRVIPPLPVRKNPAIQGISPELLPAQ